jgi:O-antigen ligase
MNLPIVFRKLLFSLPLFIPLYLFRFEMWGVPVNVLELMVYVLFGAFVLRVILGRYSWPFRSYFLRFFIPVGFLLLGVIGGVFVSYYSGGLMEALGIFKGWILMPMLFAFMLMFELRDYDDRQLLLRAYFGSAAVLSLLALYQVVTGDYITIDQRASGPFESANYLALYIAPAVLGTFASLWHGIRSHKKFTAYLFEILVMIVAALALVFSRSYGAFLGVGVAFTFFWSHEIFYSRYRGLYGKMWVKIVVPLAIVLLGGVVILAQLGTTKFDDFLKFDQQSSSSVRMQVWEVATDFALDDPVLGIGLGAYDNRYAAEASGILGYEPYEPEMLHPHNLFMATHLNSGILGLIGLVWMIGLGIVVFRRGVYRNDDKDMAVVFGVMFIVMVVHGLFDQPLWKNDLALLWWIVLSGLMFSGFLQVSGKIQKGRGLGKKLSYPTINFQVKKEEFLKGSYVCYVELLGEKYYGAGFVGPKRGLKGEKFICEVHLFGKCGDVYGKKVDVYLMHKIRDVQKFKSLKELKKMIGSDVRFAKKYLKKRRYA